MSTWTSLFSTAWRVKGETNSSFYCNNRIFVYWRGAWLDRRFVVKFPPNFIHEESIEESID